MDGVGHGTVLRRMAAQAARTPHKPALVLYVGERFGLWTYADLQARARRWAERLAEAAGRDARGRTVFVVLPHGVDLYAAFLGAMEAGLVPSMLPTPQVRQPRDAWAAAQAAVIARAEPAAVVAGEAERDALAGLTAGAAVLGPEPFRPASPGFRPRTPAPDEPALLQHSSGTTGLKKGVVLQHGQVDRHLGMLTARLGAGPDDVVASWLPLYHDMGLMAAFLLPLALGAGVVAIDPFAWVADPMSLFRAVARHRATLAWAPNFAFAHWVRTRGGHPSVDLSSLRALIDCSEPCRPETVERFLAAFADCGIGAERLACCYGMAEVVFAATQTVPGEPPRALQLDADALEGPGRRVLVAAPGARRRELLSCGPPLEGVQLRIDAPAGCAGEVLVRSVTRMAGYLGQPRDPDALAGGWRRTGDMGLLDRGELFVCGRVKEMLIVHGRNLYAGDVEALVSTLPGVKPGRAVALGLYVEATGAEELCILCETEGEPDPAGLEAVVREAVRGAFGLPPRHVVVVERGALAKSTAGKMSRADNLRRLQAHVARRPEAEASPAPPPVRIAPRAAAALTDTPEDLVRRALHDCFGVDPLALGPDAGAEQVPGWDSLGHTVLLLRLEGLAGVRLGERAAEARTVAELAALLLPARGELAA